MKVCIYVPMEEENMENIRLVSQRIRYIVPFSYQQDEMRYEKICESLEQSEVWSKTDLREGEQDVYSYMFDAFSQKDNRSNVGVAWTYEKRDKKGRILQLAWLRKKEDKEILVECKEAGLFLFRSGIGLFWYELIFPKNEMTVEELVSFQNKFKELNRSDNTLVLYQIVDDSMRQKAEGGQTKLENYPEGIDLCTNYQMIGEKENRQIKFWACKKFIMGNWIAEVLGNLECAIRFKPERKNCFPNVIHKQETKDQSFVPDKAILFQYAVIDETEAVKRDLLNMAYYLSNGYKSSYIMPEEIESQMYKPFENAYWYVTRGGCGYFIRCQKENKQFYTKGMSNKVVYDYFILYILLLYQSYTLLHYAEKIQNVLSADTKDYLENTGYTDILERITTEINVFLVKSVYASVSHIHHQNVFYEYAEKMLGIKEDIQSITLGLESLEELQKMKLREREEQEEKELESKRQQRENRLNLGLGALSLFAIFSAILDGYDIAEKIAEFFSLKGIYEDILCGAVLLVIGIVACYAVINFGRTCISNRRERKQNENFKSKSQKNCGRNQNRI